MSKTLRVLAFLCYAIEAVLAIGLLINFVVSIFKWDWSPWWWFPAGFVVLIILFVAGGTLGMAAEKFDRKK